MFVYVTFISSLNFNSCALVSGDKLRWRASVSGMGVTPVLYCMFNNRSVFAFKGSVLF